MTKVERFLRSLDTFIQKVETNDAFLQALAAEFPEFSNLANTIDEFETEIARLLRNERNHFMDALSGFAGSPLESVLVNFTTVQFIEDNFAVDMKTINQRFFDETIREITSTVMDGIDRDVAFNTVSRRTTDWIEGWSEELGEIMQLNTHEKVEKILREGIERGASIQDIELELAELPQFNRARARTTAITEVLTASSQSHYEAYKQSPAVIGKRWKHSGSAGIEPRPNHVAMTGTVVAVDEPFTIIDSIETAMYPRDPNLTARERVNCHCVMGPVVDDDILGLTPEEKEQLRREALSEMGGSEPATLDEEDLLPDYENAEIPDRKLTHYALDKEHADGKDKAVAFELALGYNKDNFRELKRQVIEKLPHYKATFNGNKGHGDLYEVIMDLDGPNGKNANVLTAWIDNGNATRLTSIYVTKKGVRSIDS